MTALNEPKLIMEFPADVLFSNKRTHCLDLDLLSNLSEVGFFHFIITIEFHVYSYRSNHGKQPTIPPPFVSFITFLLLTFLLQDIYQSLVIMFWINTSQGRVKRNFCSIRISRAAFKVASIIIQTSCQALVL